MQINLQSGPIELSAATIRGTKEPGKRIAMREELIDLNALDTGKYKGLIIQDPTDRRNVKGFVYLGTAWANDLEPTFDSAARAIHEPRGRPQRPDRGITAKVDAHLFPRLPGALPHPLRVRHGPKGLRADGARAEQPRQST